MCWPKMVWYLTVKFVVDMIEMIYKIRNIRLVLELERRETRDERRETRDERRDD
jgi:hypothetical protein